MNFDEFCNLGTSLKVVTADDGGFEIWSPAEPIFKCANSREVWTFLTGFIGQQTRVPLELVVLKVEIEDRVATIGFWGKAATIVYSDRGVYGGLEGEMWDYGQVARQEFLTQKLPA